MVDGATALAAHVQRVHGALGILLFDKDGVELHRTLRPGVESLPVGAEMLCALATTADHTGKLRMGNGGVVSLYDNLATVHAPCGQLCFCIVGTGDMNVGSALDIVGPVAELFAQVKQ